MPVYFITKHKKTLLYERDKYTYFDTHLSGRKMSHSLDEPENMLSTSQWSSYSKGFSYKGSCKYENTSHIFQKYIFFIFSFFRPADRENA